MPESVKNDPSSVSTAFLRIKSLVVACTLLCFASKFCLSEGVNSRQRVDLIQTRHSPSLRNIALDTLPYLRVGNVQKSSLTRSGLDQPEYLGNRNSVLLEGDALLNWDYRSYRQKNAREKRSLGPQSWLMGQGGGHNQNSHPFLALETTPRTLDNMFPDRQLQQSAGILSVVQTSMSVQPFQPTSGGPRVHHPSTNPEDSSIPNNPLGSISQVSPDDLSSQKETKAPYIPNYEVEVSSHDGQQINHVRSTPSAPVSSNGSNHEAIISQIFQQPYPSSDGSNSNNMRDHIPSPPDIHSSSTAGYDSTQSLNFQEQNFEMPNSAPHTPLSTASTQNFGSQTNPVQEMLKPVPAHTQSDSVSGMDALTSTTEVPSSEHPDELRNNEPACTNLPFIGECLAAYPRYYYRADLDQCDCYLYGGCPGKDGTIFPPPLFSLYECISTCHPSNVTEGPNCGGLLTIDTSQ